MKAKEFIQTATFETNEQNCIDFAQLHLDLVQDQLIKRLKAAFNTDTKSKLDYKLSILPLIKDTFAKVHLK